MLRTDVFIDIMNAIKLLENTLSHQNLNIHKPLPTEPRDWPLFTSRQTHRHTDRQTHTHTALYIDLLCFLGCESCFSVINGPFVQSNMHINTTLYTIALYSWTQTTKIFFIWIETSFLLWEYLILYRQLQCVFRCSKLIFVIAKNV